MNIFKYIFIVSIVTISCNAFGMFFRQSLIYSPKELTAMTVEAEIIRKNKETREQTIDRHNLEEIQALQKEREYIARLEKALAQKPSTQPSVTRQLAEEVNTSNQNFEEKRQRRSSTEQKPTNNQLIRINLHTSYK